jgi:hypothetical protein
MGRRIGPAKIKQYSLEFKLKADVARVRIVWFNIRHLQAVADVPIQVLSRNVIPHLCGP